MVGSPSSTTLSWLKHQRQRRSVYSAPIGAATDRATGIADDAGNALHASRRSRADRFSLIGSFHLQRQAHRRGRRMDYVAHPPRSGNPGTRNAARHALALGAVTIGSIPALRSKPSPLARFLLSPWAMRCWLTGQVRLQHRLARGKTCSWREQRAGTNIDRSRPGVRGFLIVALTS